MPETTIKATTNIIDNLMNNLNPNIPIAKNSTFRNPKLMSDLAKANHKTTLKMYPNLVEVVGSDNNMAFNPFSFSSMMSLLAFGSAGNTSTQIKNLIPLPGTFADLYKAFEEASENLARQDFDITGLICMSDVYTFRPGFVNFALDHFNFLARTMNIANIGETSNIINDWMADKNFGWENAFLAETTIDPQVSLAVLSASRFIGFLKPRFHQKDGAVEQFHLLNGVTEDVKMLQTKQVMEIMFNDELKAEIIKIPCIENRMNFYIFLPNQAEEFLAMEEKIPKFKFTSLKFIYSPVELSLPKFRLNTLLDLKLPLLLLDIKDMFIRPNFVAMTNSSDVRVNRIMQENIFEIFMDTLEAPPAFQPELAMNAIHLEVKLNRPFVFLLADDLTGLVLNIGRVMRPALEMTPQLSRLTEANMKF